MGALNQSISEGKQQVRYWSFNPKTGKRFEANGVSAATPKQRAFAETVHAEATALATLVNDQITKLKLTDLLKIKVPPLAPGRTESGGSTPAVKSRFTPEQAADRDNLPDAELKNLLDELDAKFSSGQSTPEDDATYAVLVAEDNRRQDEEAEETADTKLKKGMGEKAYAELPTILEELSNQLGLENWGKVFNGFFLMNPKSEGALSPKRRGSYRPSTRQVAFAPAVLKRIADGIAEPAVTMYRILAHEVGHAMDHGASDYVNSLHSLDRPELAFDGALWKEFQGVKEKSNTLEYEPDWAYLAEKQQEGEGIFEREFFAELFSFVVTNPDLNLEELIPDGLQFVQEMAEKAGETNGFEVADLGRRDRVAGLARNDRPPESTEDPALIDALRARAAKNNAEAVEAQAELGTRYAEGRGVKQDYVAARNWFVRAARQRADGKGNVDAQVSLGHLYEYGLGVDQSDARAFGWFEKAAKQGDAYAQNHVGIMYENGQGVDQDYSKAFKWFQEAADQEDSAGQSNLAGMYYRGEGVKQNYFKAAELYDLAAQQGDLDAKNALEEMREEGLVARDIREEFPFLLAPGGVNFFHKAFTLAKKQLSRLFALSEPILDLVAALETPESFNEYFNGKRPTYNISNKHAQSARELLGMADKMRQILERRLEDALTKPRFGKSTKNEDGTTTPGESKPTLKERLDAGKNVQRFPEFRALNITEKTDEGYQYNKVLLDAAVLAGIDWVLNQVGRSTEVTKSAAASILGISEDQVTDKHITRLSDGITTLSAARELTDRIREFWGVKQNKDADVAYINGIPEAVAKEVLKALEEAGFIKLDTIRFPDVSTNQFGRVYLDADRVDSASRNLLMSLMGVSNLFADMALTERENTETSTTPITSVDKTQLRNPTAPTTAQNQEATKNQQAAEHKANPIMFDFFRAIGLEEFVTLMSGFDYKKGDLAKNHTQAKKNKGHWNSVQGLQRSLVQSYEAMTKELAVLEAELEGRKARILEEDPSTDKALLPKLEDMGMFYKFHINRLGRSQMGGPVNPQNNKLLRHLLMPTRGTVDLSDRTSADFQRFTLMAGQALKLKPERVEQNPEANDPLAYRGVVRDKIIEQTLTEGGKYREAVKFLKTWIQERDSGNGQAHDGAFLDLLRTLQAKEETTLEIHGMLALVDIARYELAVEAGTDLTNFETMNYLEADGLANGIANSLMLFSTGSITPTWISFIAKIGAFFGHEGKTMNMHRFTDKEDPYEAGAELGKTKMAKVADEVKAAKSLAVQAHYQAFYRLFTALGVGVGIDPVTGDLTISRASTKGPMMISNYGAGETGIANNITRELVNAIYAKLTEVSTPGSAPIGDFIYGPGKQADFMADLSSLTSRVLRQNKKLEYYLAGTSSSVKLGDPMDFEFTQEQFKILSENLEILVVEPMVEAIKETVTDHISFVTDNLQRMTQMSSIFAKAMYHKMVAQALAKKRKDPEWDRNEYLTPNEQAAIEQEVLKFSPMISTGTQNLYLPGKERSDLIEKITIVSAGQEITIAPTEAFSRSLDGDLKTNAYDQTPGYAGVAAKPAFTILGGDGQMVNNLLSQNPELAKRVLQVFDGLQVPVDKINEYLELVNQAVSDSWVNNKNPVRAAYESFAAFMANNPMDAVFGKVDPETEGEFDQVQLTVLKEMSKIFYETRVVSDQDVIGVREAEFMLGRVLKNMKDAADKTDARRRTYKEFSLSVEQMASGGRPFVQIGTIKLPLNPTPEQVADAMDERYEFHLDAIRKEAGAPPAATISVLQNVGTIDVVSGARVVQISEAGDILKGLKGELSPSQKEMMRAATAMLSGSGYRLVFGNSTQLDAWEQADIAIRQADNQKTHTFERDSNNQQGKIIPSAKAILISSGQAETVIHELIHAATLAKVRAYYANPETLTLEERDAVRRIEGLMNEWLAIDPKKEGEQAGIVRGTANKVINEYKNAGKMAEAVNEFMAWVLANQDLAALAKKTTIKDKALLIIQGVLDSLYRLIFPKGKRTTPFKVADNILANLRFNTRVLMAGPTKAEQFQGSLSQVSLFQAKWFGEDNRLTEVRKRLQDRILVWLDGDGTNIDRLLKQGRLNQNIVNKRLTGRLTALFVFHFPDLKKMQAASTFSAVQQAMMTGIELNPNALIRIEELYAHTVSVLKFQDFMKDPSSTDPNEISDARDKYNLVLGKLGTTKDKFNRSSLLSAFLGLALSSDEFREVLSKLPKPKAEKSNLKGLDGVVENMGFGLIDWLSYTIAGEGRKDGNVRDAIDNLTMVLVENVQDQETAIERIGGGYEKFIADQIQTKSDEIGKKSGELIRNSNSSVVKAGAALVNGIANAINKDAAEINALGLVSRMNKIQGWEPIKDVIGDLIGRTKENAGIFDMISRVKAIVQQVREQFRNELPKKLYSMFTKPVSSEQWTSLFKVMGKADLAAIASRIGTTKALEMVTNDSLRASEIADLEGQFDPAVIDKAQQLANYMMNGALGVRLLRNAYAIAVLAIPGSRNLNPGKSMVADIDLLTSLYALEKAAPKDRDSVADLIKNNESNGLEFVLSYLMGQRKDELLKVESTPRARMNAYKGHIPSESQDRGFLMIASDTRYAELLGQGYVRVKDYTGSPADQGLGKMGYYYAKVSGRAPFSQGVLQTVHQTASGVDPETGFTVGEMNAGLITDKKEIRMVQRLQANAKAGTEELSEVYDEFGNVAAIERRADPAMLAKTDRSTNLADMIGAWRGRQAEELMAQQVNVEVIDELKRVWDQGVADKHQNEFVNIGTLDPKVDDPILVEAAGLLPRQTVKYAESVFGKGVLMVRRDLLKDTFGARQASVGDLFTGNTRWNPKVAKHFEKIAVGLFGYAGKDAFTTLVGSEQNIQDVVSGIKQTIVVRSVIVPVANMTFNMFQLLNRGVPLTTVIRGMGAKTAEINSYVKKRKREIDLEADLRAARGKKDDGAVLRIESQLQSIKDSYTRMSIWPLIEAGEFSAISSGQVTAEDLALSDGRWSNFLEKKINSLDGPLREIARYGLVTRDTALFQGLARAVQYGDFVAKAVLYDDLVKRKKVDSKDAVAQVNEAFVNYNRSPGRSRQYLESVGLLWFYNYKLRILKEAVFMLRNNPVRSLLMLSLPGIGSPMMDNVVTKGLEGNLPDSIGPSMAFGSWQLNPWINAVR